MTVSAFTYALNEGKLVEDLHKGVIQFWASAKYIGSYFIHMHEGYM